MACRPCCHVRGGLLPDSLATAHAPCGAHTVSPSPDPTSFSLQERDFATLRPQSRASAIGSLFSVPLSIASRRPAVNRHLALWSPDFPLRKRIAQRLPGQLQNVLSHRNAGVPGLLLRHDFERSALISRPPDSAPIEAAAQRRLRSVCFNRFNCNAALPDGQARKEGRFAPRVSGSAFLLDIISCR